MDNLGVGIYTRNRPDSCLSVKPQRVAEGKVPIGLIERIKQCSTTSFVVVGLNRPSDVEELGVRYGNRIKLARDANFFSSFFFLFFYREVADDVSLPLAVRCNVIFK